MFLYILCLHNTFLIDTRFICIVAYDYRYLLNHSFVGMWSVADTYDIHVSQIVFLFVSFFAMCSQVLSLPFCIKKVFICIRWYRVQTFFETYCIFIERICLSFQSEASSFFQVFLLSVFSFYFLFYFLFFFRFCSIAVLLLLYMEPSPRTDVSKSKTTHEQDKRNQCSST